MKKTLSYILILIVLTTIIIIILVGNRHPHKPNILIVVVDEQGYGDVGYNGNQMIHTPILDSLAMHHVILNRFYCFPQQHQSFKSLMTGKYTSSNTEVDEKTLISLPEILKNNHYRISFFESGESKNYVFPRLLNNNVNNPFDKIVRSGTAITDSVLQFIHQSPTPFFALLTFNASPTDINECDSIADKYRRMNLDEQTVQAYTFFESNDKQLGRIIKDLENSEQFKNTIFLFLSTSGPTALRFNNGLKGRKGQLDEGSLRVPMVLSYPNGKFKLNRIDNFSGCLLDITPTLLYLASIPYDTTSFDGINLAPIIIDTTNPFPNRTLIFQVLNKVNEDSCLAIRQNNNLLTCYQGDTALYHLLNDPFQRANIKNTNTKTIQKLFEYYKQWKHLQKGRNANSVNEAISLKY